MFGRGVARRTARRTSRRMMRRSILGLVIGGAALLALGSLAYRSRQQGSHNVPSTWNPMY